MPSATPPATPTTPSASARPEPGNRRRTPPPGGSRVSSMTAAGWCAEAFEARLPQRPHPGARTRHPRVRRLRPGGERTRQPRQRAAGSSTTASGATVSGHRPAQSRPAHRRYDAFGRVLTQTDALGHTTTYTYDDATRALHRHHPRGHPAPPPRCNRPR
ncbi:MAG: hypothetical protein M0C28_17650 [Candidatus Moduliflexus flocculans]|nr:hypothetical protein [Candidatus Moduliflexus flocculans]